MINMKAVINVDVPEWQIGQDVSIYFPDSMLKHGKCLLKEEQEAHELTKTEWEQWKKDKNHEPICMVWYGDTTPIWVLKPENVNETLYFMGKIKLFDKKPRKEQVKWNEL